MSTKSKRGRPAKKSQVEKFGKDKLIVLEQETNERLAACGRGELKEIVYIGEMVENTLLGEFGAILRALIKGLSASSLAESRVKGEISADRYLGRLDAYDKILENLEQYVIDKDQASKKIIKDSVRQPDDFQTAPEVGVDNLPYN